MTDRKILFRGFHPDDNETTTIIIDGEETEGTWVYGDLLTCGFDYETAIRVHNAYETGESALIRVLLETVGQWVTTDKNGKDVFEGDSVKALSYMDDILVGNVRYDNEAKAYEVYDYDYERRLPFSTIKYVELDIGE